MPRVFRVSRDPLGNPLRLTGRDGDVLVRRGNSVGFTGGDIVLRSGDATGARSSITLRNGDIVAGASIAPERLRTVGVIPFTGLSLGTVSYGHTVSIGAAGYSAPSEPEPPRWVPLSVISGRMGIVRLLRRRMETMPKSALERLLGEEIV